MNGHFLLKSSLRRSIILHDRKKIYGKSLMHMIANLFGIQPDSSGLPCKV